MKKLNTILVLVYVIIIILLLLGKCQCHCGDHHNEERDSTPIRHEERKPDPIRQGDSIPSKVPIKEKFQADVVMCIDCTGSMSSIINTIKNNALSFYPDLKQKCISKGKVITSMRIKVIGFRDVSDAVAFEKSPFYDLPTEENAFKNFVSHLKADGGGDGPELGYDALAQALCADWRRAGNVHQIVILWTDNASHSLSRKFSTLQSMGELTAYWKEKMSPEGKRLILFAPNESSWGKIESTWDKTTRHDVGVGRGLSDVDYEEILNTLSENI